MVKNHITNWGELSPIAAQIVPHLLQAVEDGTTLTYRALRQMTGVNYTVELFNPLDEINHKSREFASVLLSAVVVNRDGIPGYGFFSKVMRGLWGDKDVKLDDRKSREDFFCNECKKIYETGHEKLAAIFV